MSRSCQLLAFSLFAVAGTTHSVQAQPFSPVLTLSSLDGTTGTTISGTVRNESSGRTVSAAGDINGDGIDDYVIGNADRDSYDGSSGSVYVVFGGGAPSASLQLSTLDGLNGFVIDLEGVALEGISIAPLGDINVDGIDDLVLGIPSGNTQLTNRGGCYIVFGSETIGASGTLDVSGLDGTNGFILPGNQSTLRLGAAVSSTGDMNGDSVPDFIVSSPAIADGANYVIFGGVGIGASGALDVASLNGTNGFQINPIRSTDQLGTALAPAGDFNGDGFDDVIIGAKDADALTTRGSVSSGEAYVLFGGATVGMGGSIDLDTLGAGGLVLQATGVDDSVGTAVAGDLDINGDGFDDVIVGADYVSTVEAQFVGAAYVVFGSSGIAPPSSLVLSNLDGSDGFVMNGLNAADFLGNAVARAGDLNADGFGDLIVSSPFADPTFNQAGASYVVFGSASIGSSGEFDLGSLDGMNGFALHGVNSGDRIGQDLACAGDVNNDGVDDIIIGAPEADPIIQREGESYVIFGRSTTNPADFNADGAVNSADLAILLAAWGTPGADLNADGTTGSADLAILLAAWTGSP